MAGRKKSDQVFDRAFFDRAFWASCAADDVMSAIRYALVCGEDSPWRDGLMNSHLELVYDYAHFENERIDFDVKHADWVKPRPDSIAGRIVASMAPSREEAA